jgi:hypothetical protein
MSIMAKSLLRDNQMVDAHLLRWINAAYRMFCREYVIPRLNNGDQVELVQISGSTQNFLVPYDFIRPIAFTDSTGRHMDVLPSEDVRQFGEYNTFGSFVQFYEYNAVNLAPLYDSFANSVTLGIPNRSKIATASASIFTDEHVGEWLLPIDRNTQAGVGNPEDYAYRIASTAGTVAVPSATCTLEKAFRGVLTDSGTVTDLTTGYFYIRPPNQPILRIWGDPGAAAITLYAEYQRQPSKLANAEDIPEEPRLGEAIVYQAIDLGGWAYREAFTARKALTAIADALSGYRKSRDFDQKMVHNFLIGNPNARSYAQVAGNRMGGMDRYSATGINY